MKISILGKQRKGKKDFHLISDNELGFRVECIDGGGVCYINNLREIKWMDEGNKVMIDPRPFGTINFWKFDKIKITHAKKKEAEDIEIYHC